ncbi:MAG: 50S ribosomal protein L32 [Candidatus Magasanikbacteria bacterium GW2011_GWC2_40_17]|uniref:Large ribosomal subunit protein bL32 n=1 Tax=Candidatus Magasanikbacteria bacterium GW2011_GWA2_42_32 TaxID=1619039 RepID=A0A0G1CEX3_9BACT|nr:MAG: 50S ribosomal protein L32 [Candidatus Magasanikbacteria bacterium GW2011_GWC2_40_17]KKS57106.1 MAG: 50S ribosomal protein L32 [Candidatus Magasanikbacteria bacterium GW2011_GWA2_42_32]OGH85371.1 MAG: 50S ribosomal protein L32 [Candidatus Magasanikbacteria bacterium RIFOXYB2_FULL_38_10]
MGLPGHRRTSSDKRRRAAHFAIKPKQLTVCPKCKKPAKPHYACSFCGTYRGKTIKTK